MQRHVYLGEIGFLRTTFKECLSVKFFRLILALDRLLYEQLDVLWWPLNPDEKGFLSGSHSVCECHYLTTFTR